MIRASEGREHPGRSRDDAHVSPKGGRALVFDEDDRPFSIASLHLAAIGESVA